MLRWNSKLHKWEYKAHGTDSLSPCSNSIQLSEGSILEHSDSSSYQPIDDFEMEDYLD